MLDVTLLHTGMVSSSSTSQVQAVTKLADDSGHLRGRKWRRIDKLTSNGADRVVFPLFDGNNHLCTAYLDKSSQTLILNPLKLYHECELAERLRALSPASTLLLFNGRQWTNASSALENARSKRLRAIIAPFLAHGFKSPYYAGMTSRRRSMQNYHKNANAARLLPGFARVSSAHICWKRLQMQRHCLSSPLPPRSTTQPRPRDIQRFHSISPSLRP
jgi:hypothetical protein